QMRSSSFNLTVSLPMMITKSLSINPSLRHDGLRVMAEMKNRMPTRDQALRYTKRVMNEYSLPTHASGIEFMKDVI
ncbi:hypothetical protein PENTCL1PPCAC_13012, partial [Pristionchus entomophagus]